MIFDSPINAISCRISLFLAILKKIPEKFRKNRQTGMKLIESISHVKLTEIISHVKLTEIISHVKLTELISRLYTYD